MLRPAAIACVTETPSRPSRCTAAATVLSTSSVIAPAHVEPRPAGVERDGSDVVEPHNERVGRGFDWRRTPRALELSERQRTDAGGVGASRGGIADTTRPAAHIDHALRGLVRSIVGQPYTGDPVGVVVHETQRGVVGRGNVRERHVGRVSVDPGVAEELDHARDVI